MGEIFRREALETLETPEHLNSQIRIMKPHMWLWFVILVTAFSGFGIWAFLGNISDTITIEGVVFPGLGVESLTVQIDGTVQDVLYENGDVVKSGDVIAVVPNKKCEEEIASCRALIQTAQGEEKERLNKQLKELLDTYEQTSLIRSTQDGTLQNMISMNSSVTAGDTIASILIDNQASNSREVVGYLPLVNASQLQAGMEAQVCPAYAQREEYGYMKGYISSIGTMPVTTESLTQYYGNLEYIKDILPEQSCVEIRIAMYIDEKSENRFAWSNVKGEHLVVDTGTICDISIITGQKHPVELLFVK